MPPNNNIEAMREELNRKIREWFNINETTQTRMGGGIVDFEVKITKGGFEEFILPEMVEYFTSKFSDLQRKIEGIPEISSDWGDEIRRLIPERDLELQTAQNRGWNNCRELILELFTNK